MVDHSPREEDADGSRRGRQLRGSLGELPKREGLSESVDFDPETHTYRRNGLVIPHVTQILAASGKCDWSCVDEEIRLHSIKRGQTVHWLTQLEDEGALNYRTVPAGLRGFRKGWRQWKKHSGFNVLWIEKRFISHYGFAGTIDRAGSFPASTMFGSGTSGVVDLKTGEGDGYIADWVRFQLVSYTLGVDPRPAIARTIRRIAVRLQRDGKYRVKEFPMETWDTDFAVFMKDLRDVNNSVLSR